MGIFSCFCIPFWKVRWDLCQHRLHSHHLIVHCHPWFGSCYSLKVLFYDTYHMIVAFITFFLQYSRLRLVYCPSRSNGKYDLGKNPIYFWSRLSFSDLRSEPSNWWSSNFLFNIYLIYHRKHWLWKYILFAFTLSLILIPIINPNQELFTPFV